MSQEEREREKKEYVENCANDRRKTSKMAREEQTTKKRMAVAVVEIPCGR